MDSCHDAVLVPASILVAATCTTRSRQCTETLSTHSQVLGDYDVVHTPESGASPAQLPHRLAGDSIRRVAVVH